VWLLLISFHSEKIFLRRFLRSLIRRFFFNQIDGQRSNISRYSVPKTQTFFGYYDKTPFSDGNEFLLAMSGPQHNKSPSNKDNLIIGFFDLKKTKNTFYPVGSTATWCWQQGCRLQWFPNRSNNKIIYNHLVNGEYGSVIQDINTKEIIRRYEFPIYDINSDGSWAISLNFSRLHRLRPGYGYNNFPDKTENDPCPNNDGIWRMDLSSGERTLLLTLGTLAQINPLPSMAGAEHYINHLSFNPSGTRFLFFHLWLKNGKRFSRLFTCDLSGKNLYLLENEGIVSHYTWKTDNEILVFTYHNKLGSHYFLYTDKSSSKEILGKEHLCGDGHPSYNPENSLLLTDTYPDKYSERKILLYLPGGSLNIIGSYFSPLDYTGDLRCDLHPRWDRTGKKICFDSAHEGLRCMYIIDLENHEKS